MTFTTSTIPTLCITLLIFANAVSLAAKDDTNSELAEAPQPGVAVAAQAKLSDAPPTVAEVDAKIAEVVASTDLGEPVIASTEEIFQQTKQSLQSAETFCGSDYRLSKRRDFSS